MFVFVGGGMKPVLRLANIRGADFFFMFFTYALNSFLKTRIVINNCSDMSCYCVC